MASPSSGAGSVAARSASSASTRSSVDYKDVRRLRNFVTERGKIIPRRISGSCARHQRQLTRAIKRLRTVALMPYVAE